MSAAHRRLSKWVCDQLWPLTPASSALTHPVCDVYAVGQRGSVTECVVNVVSVPLDDAAALSSPVWGGPLVLSVPRWQLLERWHCQVAVISEWLVVIRAFIAAEAVTALDDVICADELISTSVVTRWCVRDHALVPLEPEEWHQWRA